MMRYLYAAALAAAMAGSANYATHRDGPCDDQDTFRLMDASTGEVRLTGFVCSKDGKQSGRFVAADSSKTLSTILEDETGGGVKKKAYQVVQQTNTSPAQRQAAVTSTTTSYHVPIDIKSDKLESNFTYWNGADPVRIHATLNIASGTVQVRKKAFLLFNVDPVDCVVRQDLTFYCP